MRLFKAIGRLIAEVLLLIIEAIRSPGRGRVVFAGAAVTALLAALVMLDANAGATLPGRPVSHRASSTNW